jgi:hypothetical protein
VHVRTEAEWSRIYFSEPDRFKLFFDAGDSTVTLGVCGLSRVFLVGLFVSGDGIQSFKRSVS